MTRGRILVAHSSRAVRAIVRRRTLAEAPEFLVDEVASADEAAARLKSGAIDIVICDEALIGPATGDWFEEMTSDCNQLNLGYIFIISEATTNTRKAELAQAGAHAFLDAKCTAADIAIAIDSVFEPRNRRQHRRVCIPGTHARIRVGQLDVSADVVNVSVAGMMCEFTCPSDFGLVILPADVALRFPPELNSELLDGIRARVLRLQIVSRSTDHLPERIRAAWQFFHVSNDTYYRLDGIVEAADEEAPPESRSLIAH